MFKRYRISSIALISGAILSNLALSTNALASDVYIGAGLSAYTRSKVKCGFDDPCERAGTNTGKIYAGYMFAALPYNGFNITHGIEAMGYQVGANKASYSYKNKLVAGAGETAGVALLYKLEVNLNNNFSIYSRLGTSYAHSSVKFSPGIYESNSSWFAPVVGLGAKYAMTKNLSLVADWDRLPNKYSGGHKAVNNMFSLGVMYSF
jgi:hypothetical protein